MTQTAVKPPREIDLQRDAERISLAEVTPDDSGARQVDRLRLIWKRRKFLVRAGTVALVASTVVAFLIPKSYTSTAQLMPPDPQSSGGMAMMAAMATKTGGDLGTIAGDLLGLKSSGALFIGVLRSETSQDRLIQQFDLRKVYGTRLMVDARTTLDENTAISEDRKSGIVTISVTDHSPQRAAALANAYVDQLNSLVSELSTTSARRERVFLEERLKVVKGDLDDASNQLAQFSSKNSTLDIQQEGKAMLDAAGTIAGEMIAAQSELEGLRQIYTDNNSRVRALNARVAELRKQLEKLGGAQAKDSDPAATPSGPSAGPAPAQVGGLPYPTIRNLPLLGAKYGDYYRRAKIEETVYELLTEQFELAKVQEAKETPSVKVLDPARVPEKKSSPHRLQIILLGTFLGSALSVMWVMGSARWEEFDPKDPRKVLVEEVTGTLKARTPWASRNGSAPESSPQEIAERSGTQGPLASGPVSQ